MPVIINGETRKTVGEKVEELDNLTPTYSSDYGWIKIYRNQIPCIIRFYGDDTLEQGGWDIKDGNGTILEEINKYDNIVYEFILTPRGKNGFYLEKWNKGSTVVRKSGNINESNDLALAIKEKLGYSTSNTLIVIPLKKI